MSYLPCEVRSETGSQGLLRPGPVYRLEPLQILNGFGREDERVSHSGQDVAGPARFFKRGGGAPVRVPIANPLPWLGTRFTAEEGKR